jgi:aspartate 1-decarboxylase
MQRIMMHSKIHRATVTGASLDYMGSITLDRALMESADLLEHEQVHVVNLNNGARFQTYVIPGERGSGVVCLNGAAARLVEVGDKVIVISYTLVETHDVPRLNPNIVHVDDDNRVMSGGNAGLCDANFRTSVTKEHLSESLDVK